MSQWLLPHTANNTTLDLCSRCWCVLHSIGQSSFYKYLETARSSNNLPFVQTTRKPKPDPMRALVLMWLDNYLFDGNIDFMPMNAQMHLPQGMTFQSLYESFCMEERAKQKDMVQRGLPVHGVCEESHFRKIRKEKYPNLKIRNSLFSRCTICSDFDKAKRQARNAFQVSLWCDAR